MIVNFRETIGVGWLEPCCNCGRDYLRVHTKDKDEVLNTLDVVNCDCGQTGYIDVMDGNAFVCWDDLSDLELSYNQLKVMYNKAIECLMESNYGDVGYLTRRGVIK
ncbi:MAG: hypothetical protein RR744_11260 [Cellulosilyticaceae bacterium]